MSIHCKPGKISSSRDHVKNVKALPFQPNKTLENYKCYTKMVLVVFCCRNVIQVECPFLSEILGTGNASDFGIRAIYFLYSIYKMERLRNGTQA